MSSISKSELARLLGDEHLGEEAYFLDVLSRWDSLRVLDYLFTEGPASTGEVARGINMDMRDVRDTLESLAEVDLVEAEDHAGETVQWKPAMRNLQVTISSVDGLDITHSMQSPPRHRNRTNNPHNSADGIFTKLGRRLDHWLYLDR